jgi:hypothetical protein
MLQIGKIKIKMPAFLSSKDKNQSIKSITDNNNNDNLSKDIKPVVPSLKDMEFSWTENY